MCWTQLETEASKHMFGINEGPTRVADGANHTDMEDEIGGIMTKDSTAKYFTEPSG